VRLAALHGPTGHVSLLLASTMTWTLGCWICAPEAGCPALDIGNLCYAPPSGSGRASFRNGLLLL